MSKLERAVDDIIAVNLDKVDQPRVLTEKQQRVCDLVCQGLSNKQIGAQLSISPRTVEAHRIEVFRKYGVRNAVELVRVLLSSKGECVHG